jgi:hypothetical protein
MLVPSQEENIDPNETRFVSHSAVSLAYTPTAIGWLSPILRRAAMTEVGRNRNVCCAYPSGLVVVAIKN